MDQNEAAHYCTCPNCGILNEPAMELLVNKADALKDAERELVGKRSQIRRMRNEADQQREMDPLREEAQMIFDYWRSRLAPGAREFSGKRLDAVLARLRAGHSVDHIKKAIDGCAAKPYVTSNGRQPKGETDERQDELELICRSEAHLRRFIGYGEKKGETSSDLIPPSRVLALQNRLDNPKALRRLEELRGWTPAAVLSLGLGLDDDRLVFFVTDAKGRITGAHRYQPNPDRRNGQPKQIAAGSRELFPRPEDFDSNTIWLVEGEPDAVAMASGNLPATSVPGVNTWKEGWADRFEQFEKVYICFDCDDEGRKAAAIRRDQLAQVTTVMVVDLDPNRNDRYDVGDLLMETGAAKLAPTLSSLATVSAGPSNWQPSLDTTPPMQKVLSELRRLDLKVTEPGRGRASSQCPNHDDRHASLSVTEGDDGRVLLHCHAGCTPDEIVDALGLQLRDLFAQR